ncbi:hypothetical protein BDZ97DRAFT_1655612, partial [Flammula alnicola]
NSEPLAIISIRLQGMASEHTLAEMAYLHLHPYLLGNLVFLDLDFNILAEEDQALFVERQVKLLQLFETGKLKRFKRFLVFFNGHSSPDTGDLHTAPDNIGAAPISMVFEWIFPPRFQKILKRSKSNMLVMLSCGSIVEHKESFNDLESFSQIGCFSNIVAFTQADFQMTFAASFILSVAEKFFILSKTQFKAIMRDHPVLGAHTHIVVFEPKTTTRYIWSHLGIRPFGNDIPVQCPRCKSLKAWKPTATPDGKIKHSCAGNGCKYSVEYSMPSDTSWVAGSGLTHGDGGHWMAQVDYTLP